MKTDPARFILANTTVTTLPVAPAIRLHLADEAHELWGKTEDELEEIGLPPPFWAFAWAGGLGLARFLLDHPQLVAGKRVVDFATGSGLVAIAALKCGARSALAADIDPWAKTAAAMNARLNMVSLDFTGEDLIGTVPDADILLAGDVFYDRDFADRLKPWFCDLGAAGLTVYAGDPGRKYCPTSGATAVAAYDIAVSRALEDSDIKKTTIWRFG